MSGRPRGVVNVTSAALRQWPLPKAGEDKESRGRVLVVGGNRQTPGAVLLAAEAALRSGAGKLQVATVESLAPHLAVALPEALVLGLPETPGGDISPAAGDAILELAGGCAAILLGPGLMDPETSVELMGSIVPRLRTTLVVDALAMAYLTEHRQGVRHLDGRAVLTPNGAELAQTLGVEPDTVEGAYAEHTVRLATSTGVVVSSGAQVSWVAGPEEGLWKIETGGPGLGVSGSGDVHAGVVLGLCARGAEPAQAAAWAAYLHGRAGDRLAVEVGRLGFLARELPAQIPRVLSELEV